MWLRAFPAVIVLMLIFFIVYVIIKNPGIVDVGWEFAHVVAGVVYYLFNCRGVFIPPLILLILLFAWGIRLGGFLLITRIIPGEKDKRYLKL